MEKYHRITLGLSMLMALVLSGATQADVPVDVNDVSSHHVIVPQCRSYGFTVDQPVIEITQVKALIELTSDVTARTTLEVTLQNWSTLDQTAEVMLPIPEGMILPDMCPDPRWAPIRTELIEGDEVKPIIQQLVTDVNNPALMEFWGANFLSSPTYLVGARSTVTLCLTYVQALQADGNRIDYVLPRTESLDYEVPWEITVQIRTGRAVCAVYSPTHKLDIHQESDTWITAKNAPEYVNVPGPFQMYYLLEDEGLNATILSFPADNYDGGYFLLLAGLPTSPISEANAIKRELTLVLDKSGSMKGTKIEQARQAVSQVISELDEGEAFNLITYNNDIDHFNNEPLLKDTITEEAALSFISTIDAGGSTNLHGALEEALLQAPMEGMLPLILFVTDGKPTSGETSEVAIRDLVLSSNPYNRRVYTLGVGYGVNAPLLDGMAEFSLARSMFVAPDEAVGTAIRDIFANFARPMLTDPWVRSVSPDGSSEMARIYNALPFTIHDLFKGDQLVLIGQYVGQAPFDIEISGNYLNDLRTFSFPFDPSTASTRNGFIPRLWTSRAIAAIIDEIRQLGADPAFHQEDERLWDLAVAMVDFSLSFGILTEYTGFFGTGEVDLLNYTDLLFYTWNDLFDRAVSVRTGKGAVNQSLNLNILRSQSILNRTNRFLDRNMDEVNTWTIQQFNDLSFFYGGFWMEGTLLMPASGQEEPAPEKDIKFASTEFFDMADRLAERARQGCLSLAQDLVLLEDGNFTIVEMPESIRMPVWMDPDYSPNLPGRTRR